MARTDLSVQDIARSGLAPSFSAANADGHAIYNDGKTFIEVKNTDASPITVTIQTPGTVDGLAISDRTVTIPATTGDKMIGPFPPDKYNQISGSDKGKVYVDFSAVSNVTVAALRLK